MQQQVISTFIDWWGETRQTFTCWKSTVKTLEKDLKKCEVCTKLTMKTVELRSDDFIVLLYCVAIVHYEQINVCRGIFACVNIITQSITISTCFI